MGTEDPDVPLPSQEDPERTSATAANNAEHTTSGQPPPSDGDAPDAVPQLRRQHSDIKKSTRVRVPPKAGLEPKLGTVKQVEGKQALVVFDDPNTMDSWVMMDTCEALRRDKEIEISPMGYSGSTGGRRRYVYPFLEKQTIGDLVETYLTDKSTHELKLEREKAQRQSRMRNAGGDQKEEDEVKESEEAQAAKLAERKGKIKTQLRLVANGETLFVGEEVSKVAGQTAKFPLSTCLADAGVEDKTTIHEFPCFTVPQEMSGAHGRSYAAIPDIAQDGDTLDDQALAELISDQTPSRSSYQSRSNYGTSYGSNYTSHYNQGYTNYAGNYSGGVHSGEA